MFTNLFSNYRPLNLLTPFSKLFERSAYNRLFDFYKKHTSLNKHQHGSMMDRSTDIIYFGVVEDLRYQKHITFMVCYLFTKSANQINVSTALYGNYARLVEVMLVFLRAVYFSFST